MSLDWLLSQVFSYVNRFYKALVSPEALISSDANSGERDITEAMIFLVLSATIAGVGFDFLSSSQTDFPKGSISIGLLYVLNALLSSVLVFVAWRLAGSKLPFDVFLRGTAYYGGVTSIVAMVISFAFLGIVSGSRAEGLAEARLAIWSVCIMPLEMFNAGFPENWADWVVLVIVIPVNLIYLLLIWWRTYTRLSSLTWKYGAWAFLTFSVLQMFVVDLVAGLSIRIR